MATLMSQIVRAYTDFSIDGKKVHIPYCMVKQPGEKYNPRKVTRTTRFGHFAGKGTPAEICQAVLSAAAATRFDLKNASTTEIHQFMLDQGIGIDCSGFAFNVLNTYLICEQGTHLGEFIQLLPGIKGQFEKTLFWYRRVRRCSAKTLTSDLNTVRVPSVQEIQPGDMMRLTLPDWSGKHVTIITEVTPEKIVYAHSGEKSQESGPHFAEIEIVDPAKDIGEQNWLEKHESGLNFKDYALHPEKGDSVRRLKNLVQSGSQLIS